MTKHTNPIAENNAETDHLLTKLQFVKDRMDEVFKKAPAFMCVLRGPNHVFELLNDRYLQLIGHRKIEGLSVRQALPEVEGQGFFELLDSVYQSGVTFSGTDMPILLQRSPDTVLEKRFLDFVYIALRDSDGLITGILVHGIDQTERKLSELALAGREEQLRLALNSADVGFWDVDTVNDQLYWPPRVKAMFGISPEKSVSLQDYYDGIHPDDREKTISSFMNATNPTLRLQYEAEYRTIGKEDKVIRWVAAKGRGIFNDANECIRVIGTAIDITHRKLNDEALRKSEERLRESDRRKDEFLAMLAHELRNPLAPISSAAQLLQIAKLDEAQVRKTSQIISRQVKHMTSLVDDLLDVSRVTRGLVELDKTSLDIKMVIAEAIEQITPLIKTRNHDLNLEMTPKMTFVVGDKKRLVQVIANLLNNAAKYTPEGGHILLETDLHDGQVIIKITDDGIGMSPELINRAFDLFAQAESTSDRSSGGLGLGLALVKSLAELHNGTVSCESSGLGKGSKFTICLPILLADELSLEEQLNLESKQSRIAPLKILLVDDNVDAASILGMLLEELGHVVVIENSSHLALERAKVESPDVYLLDIGLPEMDGNELAKELKKLPQNTNSIFIAITGYGTDNDRKKTHAAGFDYHLIKPVDMDKLTTILALFKKH